MDKIRRMLCIIVEREQKEEDVFATAVTSALREYSDEVDKGVNDNNFTGNNNAGRHDHEVFVAKNGCKIKIIHGIESINLKS